MKVIVNNIIPFRGFKAIALWPLIFVRKNSFQRYTKTDETHESIHGAQQKEMLLIFFFLWYLLEWIVRFVILRDSKKAYYAISFEKEAYSNQTNYEYLKKRKHYSWAKYLFHN